jgi:hypothetical protein
VSFPDGALIAVDENDRVIGHSTQRALIMHDGQASRRGPFQCERVPGGGKSLRDRVCAKCLSRLLLLSALAGVQPGQAGPPAAGSVLDGATRVHTVAPESGAGTPEPAIRGSASSLPLPPASGKAGPVRARRNLTVFFAIGIALNLLLITLFAVWAIGQWRKTGKQGNAD